MSTKHDSQATPEQSDRQIAQALGVDNHTVSSQRKELETTEEIPHLNETVGKDGKVRQHSCKKKRKSVVSVFNPTKHEAQPAHHGQDSTAFRP